MEPSRRQFLVTCATACGAACVGLGLTHGIAYGASDGVTKLLRRNWTVSELTMEMFSSRVGERFKASKAKESAELTLVSVHALAHKRPSPVKIEAFALTFAGPLEGALRQDTFDFEHATLGTFSLFMVPVISPKPAERRYEVIISRLVS